MSPIRLHLARALGVAGSLAVFVTLGAACGDDSADDTGQTGDTFLAFAKDFKSFRDWESLPAEPNADAPASTHTTGPRTVYINKRPPKGATEFPIGTIIVKESEAAAVEDRSIFAMVKRGGDYNAKGAANWEWFELQNLASGDESIIWRGVGPPVGEKYGGDPNGGCNGCHGAATDNDFVLEKNLRLSP